jgi:hypothetical protein
MLLAYYQHHGAARPAYILHPPGEEEPIAIALAPLTGSWSATAYQ